MIVVGKYIYNYTLWLFVVSIILFTSCEPNRTFEKNISIIGHEWDYYQKPRFEIDIRDTSKPFDIYLNIRHTEKYPFSNLWIELHTLFPSGKTNTTKHQVELGDNSEMKWNSECLKDICNAQIQIITGHRFSESGTYRFTISHIMRTNPLPEIMDIGLKIEKESLQP